MSRDRTNLFYGQCRQDHFSLFQMAAFIRLSYGNGDDYFAVCHCLDETHAEIDGVRRVRSKNLHREWNRSKINYAPA